MKYIDAEKLKAEIERLLAKAENDEKTAFKKKDAAGHLAAVTKTAVCVKIKKLITSLQQEQLVNKDLGTLIACDIIEMTVKRAIDKPQDKEKEEELMTRKINYLRSLEENYVQQEQPKVQNGKLVFP